jgi:hypothetical protein
MRLPGFSAEASLPVERPFRENNLSASSSDTEVVVSALFDMPMVSETLPRLLEPPFPSDLNAPKVKDVSDLGLPFPLPLPLVGLLDRYSPLRKIPPPRRPPREDLRPLEGPAACFRGERFYSVTERLPLVYCGDKISRRVVWGGYCIRVERDPREILCDDGGCLATKDLDLQNDPHHCGYYCKDCTRYGRPNNLCKGGICTDENGCDPEIETFCENECMQKSKFKTNKNHCGECNKPCTPDGGHHDAECVDGSCAQICYYGMTDKCDGICRDLGSDRDNCNKCGKKCSMVEICKNGVCTECPVGQTSFCTGQCQNIKGSSCCQTQTESNGKTVWVCTQYPDVCKYQFVPPDSAGPRLPPCYSIKPNP